MVQYKNLKEVKLDTDKLRSLLAVFVINGILMCVFCSQYGSL